MTRIDDDEVPPKPWSVYTEDGPWAAILDRDGQFVINPDGDCSLVTAQFIVDLVNATGY